PEAPVPDASAFRASPPAVPKPQASRPVDREPSASAPRQRGQPNQTAILTACLIGAPLILLVLIAVLIKIGRTIDGLTQPAEHRAEVRVNWPAPPPGEKREVDREVEAGTVVPNVA